MAVQVFSPIALGWGRGVGCILCLRPVPADSRLVRWINYGKTCRNSI